MSILRKKSAKPKTVKVTFDAPEEVQARFEKAKAEAEKLGFEVDMEEALNAAYDRLIRRVEKDVAKEKGGGKASAPSWGGSGLTLKKGRLQIVRSPDAPAESGAGMPPVRFFANALDDNSHPARRIAADQGKSLIRGGIEPCFIVGRVKNNGHSPFCVNGADQLIRHCCNHRKGLSGSILLNEFGLFASPEAREGEGRASGRIITTESEPVIRRGSLAFRFVKAGYRDQASSGFKALVPEAAGAYFIIAGVVPGRRFDRFSCLFGKLRRQKPPSHGRQLALGFVINAKDRGEPFGKDRRLRFRIADPVAIRADLK